MDDAGDAALMDIDEEDPGPSQFQLPTTPLPRRPPAGQQQQSALCAINQTPFSYTYPWDLTPFQSPFIPTNGWYQESYSPIYSGHGFEYTRLPDGMSPWPSSRIPPVQDEDAGSSRTCNAADAGVIAQVESRFAAHLFDDIVPGLPKQTRTRAGFQWPVHPSTDDRLLVVFRCIRKSGFDSIGEFLAAMLSRSPDEKLNKHYSVSNSISSFLHCSSIDKRTHPLAIVDAIFRHPFSQNRDLQLQLNLPRHALPPSERLLRQPPGLVSSKNTTRNALLDWALARVLYHVDQEAVALLHPDVGLTWPPKRDQQLSWSAILRWSLTETQETIANQAPMIFALLTTISVSKTARKKLETSAAGPNSSLPLASTALPHLGATAQKETDDASRELAAEPELDEPDLGDEDGDEDEPPLLIDPEADDDEIPTAGVPDGMRRDPWLGATVSILALLYLRYRYALVFPTFIGVFLFTCNANRDVFAILSRVGYSIAYSSVLAALHTLAADSDQTLRALGALVKVSEPSILLLFDNVNKMQRAWEPTISHGDEVKSGTAGTAIELEDVPEGTLHAEPLRENLKKNLRSTLTVQRLCDDIDWLHIYGVGVSHVLLVWMKHISGLGRFHGAVHARFTGMHSKHPLRLRKSKIHPMRTTNIDESTTQGVASVLFNLVVTQLSILTSWLSGTYLILVCGDQLSIDRIRKAKLYMGKADGYHQHEWAVPVIQLWHMKWALQKCIFKLHWWHEVGKEIFGLRHDCELLNRGKFNAEKCDFYPAHHILEDRFDAMILDTLRTLCEEESHTFDSKTNLLEGLEGLFSSEGPLKDISFDELVVMAETVYTRYMCTAAYESAIGHGDRDPKVYGAPGIPADLAPPSNPPVTDPKDAVSSQKPKKRTKKQARATEQRNFSHGDQTLATNINFLRLTFWYLEMCAAIAEGDIGRVFEIIKLLRFSFWGAGATNYGNELLELACNFMFEFPDTLKTAVLNNYLVNPSGRHGHWLELDLLQEHFNFWIKRLFNSKSHDFDARHLSEAVSLNIGGFSLLRDRFPGLFGAKKNSHRHTGADKRGDINRLGFHFHLDKILSFIPNRMQAYLVGDEFDEGFNTLDAGQLRVFLNRTGRDDSSTGTEHSEGVERTPANPITSSNGVMEINAFTGDDNSM